MARRIEPTVFLATISPITVGLVVGTVTLVRIVGGGWVVAVLLGLVVWVGRILLSMAVARRVRGLDPRIDPFALREPWRFFVRDALSARNKFASSTEGLPGGPLQTRLAEIGRDVESGVASVWQIAQRGQQLTDTRRAIDVAGLDRTLASVEPDDPRYRSAVSQRESHDRIAAREQETRERLEVLDAQLDEAVVRVAELATRDDDLLVDDVARQIHTVVSELDSLRIALDELGPAP